MKNQPTPFNNAYRIQHLKHTYLSGMVWCQDCGFNLFARVFIGIVMGIASIFTFGFPPSNESNVGAPLSAWPYIFACWLALYARWFTCTLKNQTKIHQKRDSQRKFKRV